MERQQPYIIRETSEGFASCTVQDEMFANREILCSGEIDAGYMDQLILQVRHLEKKDRTRPITVFIDSPGGEVTAGLSFYDVLKGSACPIRTVCIGTAASMGAVIFLAGEERQILPHAKVLLHDPSMCGRIGEKALQLRSMSDWLMKERESLLDIISERCGRDRKEIEGITAVDTLFNAGEAVAFGIATEIVTKV